MEDIKFRTIAKKTTALLCTAAIGASTMVTVFAESEFPNITDKEVTVLTGLSNSKAIDVADAGKNNGNLIIAADATGVVSQQWKMKEGSEKGWYNIVNVNSDKGIGMSAGTTVAGEQPIQWVCNGSADQFWRFVEVPKDGETYYKIINKNSKLILTMGDDKVTQESYTGEDNQLWKANTTEGFAYGSKYDDNYGISAISLRADNNVIGYTVMLSRAEGMYLEVRLSDSDEVKSDTNGTFNVDADGEYTITASLYEDDTKEVKVCDDFEKSITLTNGGYDVIGADWICSTESSPWTNSGTLETRNVTADDIDAIKASNKDYVEVDQNTRYQEMDASPWGGCFNEMGWEAIMNLDPNYAYGDGKNANKSYEELTAEQKEVIDLLFKPGYGIELTAGRTPIGSSDFGLDMYTYDETTDDYNLDAFSIERDTQHLIPFIEAAEHYVPNMPIFSSPWTPPTWMKRNNRFNGKHNSNYIEDTDENFAAYAKYFIKYLDEYHKLGIDIQALTPQNEPTMDTPYPSCVWNGDQLNRFLRDYLCPAVAEYNNEHSTGDDIRTNVEVWLGTFTDSNQSMAWPTYKDEKTSTMVDGYCFQWWGAPLATKLYKDSKANKAPVEDETVEQGKVNPVKMIQSETKCGGGENNWTYAEEQFDCYKEFLDAGVSQYHLWNMVLDGEGKNNALPEGLRWPQCAPITVNDGEYQVNPSFYEVKHFSANVKPYARRIKVSGNNLGEGSVNNYVQDVRAVGFQNTDGEVVVNLKNSTAVNKDLTVIINDEAFDVTVPAHSINTFSLEGEFKSTPDATEVTQVEETTNMKFSNAASGLLLSASGYSNGDTINLTSNRGESSQTWKLVKSAHSGYYHLVNFDTDLGVAVWGGSTDENAEIKQYENTGADDQQWQLEFAFYRGEGAERHAYYKIVNYKSKLVLTALGTDEGIGVTQMSYSGIDSQLWNLDVVGGEWEFPKDDTEPKTETEITYANNKYTLNTKLINNVVVGSDLIIGAYSSDGKLISVKSCTVTEEKTVATEFEGVENASYFDIMVWDSFSKMKSVTKKEVKQLTE